MQSMAKKEKTGRPPLFTIRADEDLWDALDAIQVSQVPVRDRSAIVKELIFKEAARIGKAVRK